MDVVKQRLIAGEGTPEATWQAWFADHPLPVHQLSTLLGNASNIIVVAPHPDDEIVGCAGLLRQAARLGVKICIVAVTDGEASHTGSRNWTTQSLSRTRTEESLEAVRRLSIHARRDRLAIADGTVSQHESELSERLMPFIMPGDAVIAPWCFDGHPDHEAVSRASRSAASARGGRFLEVPIWGWHWVSPAEDRFPWHRAIALELNAEDQAAKAHAVDAFRSQLTEDPSLDQGPILPAFVLARLLRSFEVVLR